MVEVDELNRGPEELSTELPNPLPRINLRDLTPKERMEALIGREPEDHEVEMALDLNLL